MIENKQKKYWCPTHPEIESDDPNAICTKCGTMKLIPRVSASVEIPKTKRTFKEFLPLVAMTAVVIILTLIFDFIFPPENLNHTMIHFMGSFFLVFGVLKMMKIKDFAIAYQGYDLIAMKSLTYAKTYPFIEFALGVAFIANFEILTTSWITFILMTIGALGVFIKLLKKEEIPCACLGTVFKVPMTYVTLIEDLLMAGMALAMIISF